MWIDIFNVFTKVTAWPVQKICFRTKIIYENKTIQSRSIKGPAVIISNHTSVFDYAAYLFVFPMRTLRFQMAEVLYRKKFLGTFLKMLGGIYIDRNSSDFSFVTKSCDILEGGGVVGIFPESRIPKKDEEKPLPFKPSAAFIALQSGAPIIPVYTNGSYFRKKRARVIIGEPINPDSVEEMLLSDSEKIDKLTDICRNKIIELGEILNENKK